MNLSRFNHVSRIKSVSILVIVFAAIFVISLHAAVRNEAASYTDPELRLKWYSQFEAMKDKSMFKHLPWQFIGPTNISGRMTDLAVVSPKGKNYTIYITGASGGVWKTENEGTTWEPIFQNAASTAFGDIALAPSNPDIIWIGTGEANIFRSSQAGIGVYKSTDAGKTWQHKGLTGTYTIPRIIIHPTNPDIVYVAASGHEWTDNPERGIYKTTDGGNTWEKIFYINEKTGIIDLLMDPTDPNTLYASSWQRIRKKYNDPRNEPGYSGSGIYKSTDAGKTWKPINQGLLEPQYRGRIGIDLCLTKPNIMYAFIDNYEIARKPTKEEMEDAYGRPRAGIIKGATVFRSDDKGETWKQVSIHNSFTEQLAGTYGWVFGQIRVDPNNENKLFVMGVPLTMSEDGGKTFREVGDMHADHHGLWIDPANSNYIVNVNDGGFAISYDGGKNWRSLNQNFPLVQFFNIAYDMGEPFHLFGSVQDHGSYRGVVDLSKGRDNIPAVKWEEAPGGEGSSHAIDPTDSNIIYSAGFYGNITRFDWRTQEDLLIVPKPPKGELPYRGQWLAPFILSSHNPRILYLGLNYLFRSLNRGDSWERISPDLTLNDPKTMGDIQYHTIFTISESPLKFGLIYAGTDDGRLHVTQDSGKTWTEITKGLAPNRWMSRVIASAYEEGTVYLSQNGKRDDDFTPYLWKSTDYGKTWKSIVNNIPLGPINVIREDPKNKNILYVGTDGGVYISLNGGAEWQVLSKNFPTTYVHDLVIHPRESILAAATHGRGVWVMDVRFLQQMTPDVLSKEAFMFGIDAAKLPRLSWYGWYGAQNAYIHYYLKTPAEVKLTISDEAGKLVKELKGSGDTGLNSIEWDLTGAATENKEEIKNPYVQPGKYKIRLMCGSIVFDGTIEVIKK